MLGWVDCRACFGRDREKREDLGERRILGGELHRVQAVAGGEGMYSTAQGRAPPSHVLPRALAHPFKTQELNTRTGL